MRQDTSAPVEYEEALGSLETWWMKKHILTCIATMAKAEIYQAAVILLERDTASQPQSRAWCIE